MSNKWKTRARDAEAALQRLQERLANPEIVVDDMHYSPADGLRMTTHVEPEEVGSQAWGMRVFAASFARTFRDSGAENYVEQSALYTDPDTDEEIPLLLTLQRRGKKTPHTARAEAEAEIQRLVGILIQVKADRPTAHSDEVWRQVNDAIVKHTPKPEKPEGHDCTSCGATVAACDQAIKDGIRACCPSCSIRDTHGLLVK